MLIETVTSLFKLLNSINEDSMVSRTCKVTVLTDEKYRENIALQEKDKTKEIKYPIIVVHDENIDYDVTRFYNDNIQSEPYLGQNAYGDTVYFRDIHKPLLPYNLNYRIEIICKKRLELDTIMLWVIQNIPDRGSLDVPYKDENNKGCIYNSLLKRGNILKADDRTSSVPYRRIFELRLTTLIDGGIKNRVVLVEHVNITEKGENEDGEAESN